MTIKKQRLMCGIILLMLFCIPVFAQTGEYLPKLLVLDEKGVYSLTGSMVLLEDRDGMTPEQAADVLRDGGFRPVGSTLPNLGFTKSAVWVGFRAANSGCVDDWVIEIAFSLLDGIELYKLSPDGLPAPAGRSGRNIPYSRRYLPHRHFFFPLSLDCGEDALFLMRIVSDDAMIIPLKISTKEHISRRGQPEYFLFGMFNGIAAAMFLYNLFLFIVIKDRSYLYYIIYLASFVLFQMAMNGTGIQFLWKDNSWWAIRSDPFFLFCSLGFGTLFSMQFLDMKSVSKTFYRILITVGIISVLMTLLSLLIDVQVSVVAGQILPLITVSIVIPAGILSYRKGNRFARFYFIAWSVFLLGIVFSTVRALGILPQHFITEHGIQIGGALEMILLSLALADRIHTLQKEKQRAELEKESIVRVAESRAAVVSDIVGELKDPLNEVVGLTEMILSADDEESVAEHANQILCESENLIELITGLHDYTRMETGKLELNSVIFSLRDTIENCLFGLRLLIEDREIGFNIIYDESLPLLVEGDAYRFKQIMMNLVQHAYKNTESGHIHIKADLMEENPANSTGAFLFEIRDTGKGMGADEIRKATNPGSADSCPSIRMGEAEMGLTISRHLIGLMGGRFSIESQPGKGTVFSVVLLFKIHSRPEISPVTEETASFSGRVLLGITRKVDCLVVAGVLEEAGLDVVCVYSGDELKKKNEESAWKLIIVEDSFLKDSRIPQWITHQEGINKDVPVAVIVNAGDTDSAGRFGGWEPDDLLEKPLRKSEIISLLGRSLR